MAGDYYDDAGYSNNPAPTASDTAEPETSEEGQETTMVPKSMFVGKEPEVGKECTFKVVSIRGDEVEVAYSHSSDEEPEAEETETAAPMPEMSGEGMSSMME